MFYFFLLFYNDFDLNNQKILRLPSIYQFERKPWGFGPPQCGVIMARVTDNRCLELTFLLYKLLCMAFFCSTSDFVRDMCLLLPNLGFMSEKKPVSNFYSGYSFNLQITRAGDNLAFEFYLYFEGEKIGFLFTFVDKMMSVHMPLQHHGIVAHVVKILLRIYFLLVQQFFKCCGRLWRRVVSSKVKKKLFQLIPVWHKG